MRKSGTVGIVSVTSTVGASIVCTREKRCQDRPLRLDRRTPPAGHFRGGAGPPVPPVPRVQYPGASVLGGGPGKRPDRAPGGPGDPPRKEDPPGGGVRGAPPGGE